MKRILLITPFLFLTILFQNILYSQINQDWKWLNPVPQGNTLRWVKAISPLEWAAVGYNGTFMRTTNAGANWELYTNAGGTSTSTGQGNNINGAWFINSSTGLVCGANSWIARTTNSGAKWDSIGCPLGPGINLNTMYFVNDSLGFIGGNNGNVFKTTNGGVIWTTVYTGQLVNINSIFAFDENKIYLAYSNIILRTTNSGTNWIFDTTSISNTDVFYLNESIGVVCGSAGNVKITTNGGDDWISKPTGSNLSLTNLYCMVSASSRSAYTQNFDSTAFPPAGWRAVNVRGNFLWNRSTTQSHSAPASAFINYQCDSLGGLDWLITPQLSISAGDSLSFWLRTLDYNYPPDSLVVRVSTTDTALSSFTTRLLYLAEGLNYPDSAVWQRYSVSLNSYAGQNIYIGFKHQDSCGDGLFLDDFAINSQGGGNDSLIIYAAGDTGFVYKSTNMGNNWTSIPILEPGQYTGVWNSIDISGSTMILGGNNGIFNISTNNGANWTAKNYRLGKTTLYDAWCNYGIGKVWVVGASSRAGSVFDQVLYSSNGGNSFSTQNVNGSFATYRSISMANDNTGYICGTYGSIRKTVNGGTSWDSLITPIPNNLSLYKIDFVDANTGWVFSNTSNAGGTIWKTTNAGVNWNPQTAADTTASGKRFSTAIMMNANTGYCVSLLPSVHMTTNGGTNWVIKSTQSMTGTFNDISMFDDSSGFMCANGRLFRTTNSWETYDSMSMPFSGNFIATKWMNDKEGFVAVNTGLVLRTTDRGFNWDFMTTSASSLNNLYAKTIDTAYVVGGNGSILKMQKGLVSISWKNTIPDRYFLGQNYPNPFNPSTSFRFGISNKAKVNLKVYDVTGRLVQTYFNNMELNPGTITVKFNGENFASGIYFYTLFVDDNRIDTKKMVLVK